MTSPEYSATYRFTSLEKAALDEAIRLDRANCPPVPEDCNRCGGLFCDSCSGPSDDYVPEYRRLEIKRWRPNAHN
jgi:hypothetical protein